MKKSKKYLIITLILVEIFTLTLTIKSFNNRNIVNEVVEENTINNKKFAIYVENDEGSYVEYTSSNYFPSSGYEFNSTKSECIDINNNTIEGILSYSDGKITVTSNKTSYCYVYFDLKATLSKLCSSGDNLGSCLIDNNSEIDSLNDSVEGGLYRYQGTEEIVNDNYICFGTTDKEECVSNTDAHMYRIIGINSSGQLKLIKNEALNSTMQWYSDYTTDITWPQSVAYSSLNGSSFLTNTTYVPSGWSDKIATTTWKYGDNTNVNVTAASLYSTENGWTNTTSAKIGLMYAYDYFYAYQSGGLNCSVSGSYTTCVNAWLHLSKCDSGAPSTHEWTMSRYGSYNGTYAAWGVTSSGSVNWPNLTNAFAVRTTFYLNSDEVYVSGSGTKDDPIIIREPEPTAGETIIDDAPTGLETTAQNGMYRFVGTDVNNYVNIGGVSYRIIGITSEANSTLGLEVGQLKVIKTDSIGTYNWHSSYTTDTKWESSAMYTYLQGSNILGSTSVIPSGWSDKIDSVKWYIGDLQGTSTTYIGTASTVLGYEDNTVTTGNSKIGLMYLSDWYYAYNSGGTQNCSSSPYCSSWMTISSTQWTMTRYGYNSNYSYYNAWYVYLSGNINNGALTGTATVRPTFYLTLDVQCVSGTGTESDPYVLE